MKDTNGHTNRHTKNTHETTSTTALASKNAHTLIQNNYTTKRMLNIENYWYTLVYGPDANIAAQYEIR